MSHTRKLIHNMEKVAGNIIDYIMKPDNQPELIALMATVANEYNKPLSSYIWYPIYFLFRTRGVEVNQLVSETSDLKQGRFILTAITRFLETGGWASTSANPNLLYGIIARLPDYQLSDPDPRASLTLQELSELNVILKGKAELITNAVKGDLTQKEGVAAELDQLPKRDMREIGKRLPANSLYKEKPLRSVNKLDQEAFKDVREILNRIFKERQEMAPVHASKLASTPSPVVDIVVEEPGLDHPYIDPMVIASPPPPPPPPPPVSLSYAAAVASESHYKCEIGTYVVPPRHRISEERRAMVGALFVPKKLTVLEEGTCDNDIVSVIKLT